MLKSFIIEGLYGLFTYHLNFRQGVFIITGPNGFGKTTILRCINYTYNGEFWRFYFLKFKRICLTFDNGSHIEMNRTETAKNVLFGEPAKDVNVKLMYTNSSVEEQFDVSVKYISRLARFQIRRDSSRIEEYLEGNYDMTEDDSIQQSMPNMLRFLYEKRCNFVVSQRLVYGKIDSRGNHAGIAYSINDVNERIRQTYQEAQNVFSKTAQSTDGSFIERLSERIKKQSPVTSDISASEMQQIIMKYRKYHLIEEMNVDVALPASYDTVRNLYLEDIKTKLASLERYYDLLSLFDQFVTGQGLSYKAIELSEAGITVKSDKGDEIPLNKLSSGEQNLVILAYHLVFESSKGDILLVDEPENSLHMSWLEGLLNEYIRIAKITDTQVVMATHSPTFIGSRWDLTYDLFENNKV